MYVCMYVLCRYVCHDVCYYVFVCMYQCMYYDCMYSLVSASGLDVGNTYSTDTEGLERSDMALCKYVCMYVMYEYMSVYVFQYVCMYLCTDVSKITQLFFLQPVEGKKLCFNCQARINLSKKKSQQRKKSQKHLQVPEGSAFYEDSVLSEPKR